MTHGRKTFFDRNSSLFVIVAFACACYIIFFFYLDSGSSKNTAASNDEVHQLVNAYSLWLRPNPEMIHTYMDEISRLGKEFNGTFHPPHVTLYGPVYATDERYVLEIAEDLARKLPPIQLNFDSVKLKIFNVSKRWPGGIKITYKKDSAFMAATRAACLAFGATDQQKPHLTLLYDFDGGSARDMESAARTRARLDAAKPASELSWTAGAVEVWQTRLRPRWMSAADMRAIVSTWQWIATYPLRG
jgi:hypothetical protein